jgi:hypothetical protein
MIPNIYFKILKSDREEKNGVVRGATREGTSLIFSREKLCDLWLATHNHAADR